jgi:hypothetical protein
VLGLLRAHKGAAFTKLICGKTLIIGFLDQQLD